jgi:hypothetical protein
MTVGDNKYLSQISVGSFMPISWTMKRDSKKPESNVK